jgi:hypothetical protein
MDVKRAHGGDVSDSWCRVSLPEANDFCGLNPRFEQILSGEPEQVCILSKSGVHQSFETSGVHDSPRHYKIPNSETTGHQNCQRS